jgi:AcrR family transcriptional regulator
MEQTPKQASTCTQAPPALVYRPTMDIRDRILAAAARVYTEAGFRGTTTRRVAEEAGVNEITLFRQFGTKDALIKSALHASSLLKQPSLGEPTDPQAQLTAWALNTYRHWYHARHLVSRVLGDLIEHPELAPDICEETSCAHRELSDFFTRMRAHGLTDDEFNAGLLLGALFTHAVWRDYFTTPELPSPEVVIAEYVRLALRSVGARAQGAARQNGSKAASGRRRKHA